MSLIGWRHDRFAELIKESETTLESLSAQPGIGKSKETLRRYADARSGQEPSYPVGMAIARHFNVHPNWLAGLRETRGRFPNEPIEAEPAKAK